MPGPIEAATTRSARPLLPDDLNPVLLLSAAVMALAVVVFALLLAKRAGDIRRRELEAELAALAAGTAKRDHELRNGLAGISGVTELLRELPADRERLRAAVESELDRLTTILDGGDGAVGHYRLGAVVSDVTLPRRRSLGEVDVDVPPDLWVSGDRMALAQVLANVLGNCARHAPGAPVEIRAHRRDDRVRLVVEDGGPGLSPEVRARAMEPETRSSSTGGSGLGLAISRQLLAEEGATITVQGGRRGTGCAVLVELSPAAPETAGER